MASLVNGFVAVLILFISCGLFFAVNSILKKFTVVLCGVAALVLAVLILPSANEDSKPTVASEASTPYSGTAPREAVPTVGVTLRNYKEKGDSIHLECSGSTGNITCKPKR